MINPIKSFAKIKETGPSFFEPVVDQVQQTIVVELSLRLPYWRGSITSLMSSSIQEITKSSRIFDRIEVRDISLTPPSLSGRGIFGTGVI